MVVTLNMTYAAVGFPLSPLVTFNFTSYIHTLALVVSSSLLWHVSCDKPYWRNMGADVFSAKGTLLC